MVESIQSNVSLFLTTKQSPKSRAEDTPKNTNAGDRSIDLDVANLLQIANNECVLLYSIGTEINKLLSDLFLKDKEILNLRNMVTSLSATIAYFYNKMQKINGPKAFEAFCQCASKSYLATQKSIKKVKKEKSKSYVHKLGAAESSHVELKKKFRELEEENKTLKDTINQANNELEKFHQQANGYIYEKEEYKRKYREAQKNYTKLQGEHAVAKLSWETTRSANDGAIKALKNDNKALLDEILKIRRENELMIQAKNESIEAMHISLTGNNHQVISEYSLLDSEDESSLTVDIDGIIEAPQSTPEPERKSVKWDPEVHATESHYQNSIKNFQVTVGLCELPVRPENDLQMKRQSSNEGSTCPSSCVGIRLLQKLQTQRDEEKEKHKLEVDNLKKTILELENGLVSSKYDAGKGYDTLNGRFIESKHPCETFRQFMNVEYTANDLLICNEDHFQNLERELQEKYEILMAKNQRRISDVDSQNIQLKKKVSQLLKQVSLYENSKLLNEELTEHCQQGKCKGELIKLKDKLIVIRELLHQKVDQHTRLETEYQEQNELLSEARRTLLENKAQYENEVSVLQSTVAELKEQLTVAEEACEKLREDYKFSQTRVEEYTQLYENLKEKLQSAQSDVTNLNTSIGQLQADGSDLKKELQMKNEEITKVKVQMNRLNAGEQQVLTLQAELENVFKQLNLLKAKNEALYMELCEVKQAAATYSHRNKSNEFRVNQYFREIQLLQKIRTELVAKNQACVEEIDYFRSAYSELYKKYETVLREIETLRHQTRLRGGCHAISDEIVHFQHGIDDEANDCYSIDNEDMLPNFWIEKVNNMTEELETSSEYWESKLSDHCLLTKDQ
ncbi:putative leucine-rich repeat-containing protein DDB_G0290503 isoform X2 [Photinus pyralis]|nr:putative leucine-rich repeat-containing protein DDB_G0290503 isoform X2 [Photinus pyralis]